jgi:mono/diheme cytochrome c family protein
VIVSSAIGAAIVLLLVVLVFVQLSGSREQSARASIAADADRGRQLYISNCATCHGRDAQGMPRQGVRLRGSKFVAGESDQSLVEFLKVGRMPNDPRSVSGLFMPPRGGNRTLEDDDLAAIVAYLRQLQRDTSARID